jgi:hypothetical protein
LVSTHPEEHALACVSKGLARSLLEMPWDHDPKQPRRKPAMITYTRELTVAWGEFDPFGLVYYPMMFTWFKEAEHDLLRELGFSTNQLIKESRAVRIHSQFQDDGSLTALPVPDDIRAEVSQPNVASSNGEGR